MITRSPYTEICIEKRRRKKKKKKGGQRRELYFSSGSERFWVDGNWNTRLTFEVEVGHVFNGTSEAEKSSEHFNRPSRGKVFRSVFAHDDDVKPSSARLAVP